jgi:hypothetical protein
LALSEINISVDFKQCRGGANVVGARGVATLRSNVDRVLEAGSFLQTLRAQRIEISQVSRPKQTETTQRWKLALRSAAAGSDIPTKIEFSRRVLDEGVAHEDVKIATAEKALFDLLYLAPGRSRLFATLPEMEIPRKFRWAQLTHYVALVKAPSRRTHLTEAIARLRKS